MSQRESNPPKVVTVDSLPIPLVKLLKFADMVSSGGEGKYVIGEGMVKVNGAVETRKGKKIIKGDVVTFEGQRIQVT